MKVGEKKFIKDLTPEESQKFRGVLEKLKQSFETADYIEVKEDDNGSISLTAKKGKMPE